MSSQSSGRRRSNNRQQYSAEDQALNMISKEAEARLAAKRAARAEAREIRMKEIEKQQKESDARQDRVYGITNEHAGSKSRQLPGSRSGSRQGSRRGSTESNDSDAKDMDLKKRTLKLGEVRELEEKYKAAMMTSAQLDNEKQSLVYQVELLKDQLEEQDEGYTELQREYKEKCREYDFQKRDLQSMEHELSILKQQLEIKDRLIEESGFVIVANDKGDPVLEKTETGTSNGPLPSGAVLVSTETRDFLDKAGGGTLGTALSDGDNKSLVDSNTGQKASHSVSSSPVDVINKGKGQEGKGEDEVDSSSQTPDTIASVDRDRAKAETLHDSNDVTTNETVKCEHDAVVESPCRDGDDGTSGDTGSTICRDDSGIAPGDVDVDGNEDSKESLRKEDSGLPCEVPSVTVSEFPRVGSSKELGGESDEDDKFYDAISTPSPFDKSGTFELGEAGAVDRSEGSSVDAVEENNEIIEIRSDSSDKDRNVAGGRDSVIVENVTETESTTDVINESEEEDESKTEDESKRTDEGGQLANVGSSVDAQELEAFQSSEDEAKTNGAIEDVEKIVSEGDTDSGELEVCDEKEELAEGSENRGRAQAKESAALESSNSEENSDREIGPINTVKDIKDSAQQFESEKQEFESDKEQDAIESDKEKNAIESDKEQDAIESDKDQNAIESDKEQNTIESDKEQNATKSSVDEVKDSEAEQQNDTDSEPVYENIDISKPVEGGKEEENKEESMPVKKEQTPKDETEMGHVISSEDQSDVSTNDLHKEDADVTVLSQAYREDAKPNQNDPAEEKDMPEKNRQITTDSTEKLQTLNTEDQAKVTDSSPVKEDKDLTVLAQAQNPKMMARAASMGESEASDAATLDDDYDLDDIEEILEPDVKETENTANPSEFAEADMLKVSDEESGSTKSSAKVDKAQASETTEKHKSGIFKGSKKKESSAEKKAEKKSEKTEKKSEKTEKKAEKTDKKAEKKIKEKEAKDAGAKTTHSKDKAEAAGGSENRLSKAESETSLEPDDLEGALEKHIKESSGHGDHKKSKKLNFLKKVFK